jgi:hypothetical protein
MSTTERPFGATVGAISLGLAGAATAGAGFAGVILTTTVDFNAFGAFASFVNLAVPYAYGAAAVLVTLGIATMVVANGLYAGHSYKAGLLLSGLLAAAGVAAFLLSGRLPVEWLGQLVSGLAVCCALPFLSLLLASPFYRR